MTTHAFNNIDYCSITFPTAWTKDSWSRSWPKECQNCHTGEVDSNPLKYLLERKWNDRRITTSLIKIRE